MQATNINLKTQIQGVYERAYYKALQAKEPNEVHIGIQAGADSKVFVEKNFYWCGFNNIRFKAVGKNRELKPLAKYKAYPSGFYLDVDTIGQRGNGDYEIQAEAFHELARFLNEEGYDVDVESRLD